MQFYLTVAMEKGLAYVALSPILTHSINSGERIRSVHLKTQEGILESWQAKESCHQQLYGTPAKRNFLSGVSPIAFDFPELPTKQWV